MFTASVILLGLGVTDGFVQALAKGFRVGALLTQELVILLEIFNLLTGFELLLQVVFDSKRQTTDVVVDTVFKGLPISTIVVL